MWWGGFHQLNWFASKYAVAYVRYDWIDGHAYDDTTVGGKTKADPWEWDVIAGLQYLILENFKLIGEYRHHRFEDRAVGKKLTALLDWLERTHGAADGGSTAEKQ